MGTLTCMLVENQRNKVYIALNIAWLKYIGSVHADNNLMVSVLEFTVLTVYHMYVIQ